MIGRRLLMAGGGSGGFPERVPVVTSLSTAPAGAWSHTADPKALYLPDVGQTVFGYVDGTSGNVELRAYDHAAGTISGATNLHSALGGIDGNPDHHDAPAILRRASDGRLVTVYSGHAAAACYRRISTNPDDASAFGAETNLDSQIGATDYTYPNLVQLTGETNAPIYLFIRDLAINPSDRLIYSKSTDDGVTWSAKTTVYNPGASRSVYWKLISNGVDRVDFFVTDGSMPNETAPVRIYHFYMTGGTFYKSDGTHISASLPFGPSDVAQVYGGSLRAWPFDAVLRPDDNTPEVVIQIATSGETDNELRDYRYRGGSWVGNAIVSAGGIWVANISPGVVFDHQNPDTTYLARLISGKWELWRYRTYDDGATWTGTAMTSSSAVNNLTPSPVYGHNGQMPVVWFRGSYTDYNHYSTGVAGLRIG
jgi:hypothetical protein